MGYPELRRRNIMGASKRVMEDLVMAYNRHFKVTTAHFANVAFSNGSLPDGWLHRLQKRQPLAAPSDVKRYFVSPEESGQICMLACILGRGGEVFFPKPVSDKLYAAVSKVQSRDDEAFPISSPSFNKYFRNPDFCKEEKWQQAAPVLQAVRKALYPET